MRTWETFSSMATRSSRLAARAFLGLRRLRTVRAVVMVVVRRADLRSRGAGDE